MRCDLVLYSSILLSMILSFSVYPASVSAADTLTTHAKVSLVEPVTPTNPNDGLDPYDPDDPYPGDDNDSGNNETGSVGKLTLDYVSDLRFGSYQRRQGGLIATAKNTHAMVQVTDARGSGSGWTLQLKPDELVGEQSGSTIDDGYLYLGSVAINKSSNNASAPPVSKSFKIPLGTYENIVVAPIDTGLSTWTIGFNQDSDSPTQLVLNDISNAPADHYVGSLSWSLTNAPS